jgi:CPA2 family monovalent cation:H+ antiporter-2
VFLFSFASDFNYSSALGAFIMGSILAETVLVHRIEELIVPIRDIFGAIFFISVGMLINPAVIVTQWQAVLLITLVLVVGKVSVITIGTFLTGQSVKTSVRAGFGMAQIGEFSFIIASLGLTLNAINDSFYPIIVAVSSITTFTTPYMMRLSAHIGLSLEKKLPHRVKYFLESYSAWVYRTQSRSDENSLLRSVTVRLIINGIIVAIVFILINKFMFPEIHLLVKNGKILEIRPLLPSDEFAYRNFFYSLQENTIYYRFFYRMKL